MKTKVKRLSKRSLAVFLGVLMLVSSIGIGSLITVNAWTNQESLYIYFDNTNVGFDTSNGYNYFARVSDWGDSSAHTQLNSMSKLTGTNLLYTHPTSYNYGGSNLWYHLFVHTSSSYGSGNWDISKDNLTKTTTYGMNFTSGATYLMGTDSTNTSTQTTPSSKSGYTAFNQTLTVKTMLYNGSSYAETSTKYGTFSASGAYKLTAQGTSGESTLSQTNGTGTLSTALTNTATISQTPVSGYTFMGWKSSKDTTGSGLTTGTYSHTNSGSATTIYAYYKLNREALPTPTISFTNSSITASSSGSATLTVSNHSTISGKDSGVSYELYKGGTKVTQSANTYTYSNGVFTIPARYSNAGTYTVKAIAANTTSYSDSTTSSGAALTITRTNLAKPTISLSKTAANNTDTDVTVTVSNYAALKDHCTFTLGGSTASAGINSSGVYTLTSYTNVAYNGGSNSITVKATLKSGESEYYTINSNTTSATSAASTLTVYQPIYSLCGKLNRISGSSATENWNAYNSTYAVSTTTATPGVYTITFTTKSDSGDDPYLGLYKNGDKRYGFRLGSTYYNKNGSDYTVPVAGVADSANLYVQTMDSSNPGGSLKFTKGKTYTLTIDQTKSNTDNPGGKITISSNNWSVSTAPRYQSYNLTNGSYNSVATGTTGGTASPASTSVVKGQSTTLTATPASGYSFVGWYTNSTCTTAASGSYTSASYTATPSADTTYYALFKQNEPAKVNISVANISHATITAKWNTQTKTNGQSLTSVPVGASVTVTVTPESDQYYVTSNTPTLSSGKFTVTASTTNITATIGENKKVTAKSNKSSRGTVSVSPQWAHSGQTVTVTVKEDAGKFKSVTATDSLTGTVLLNKTSSGATYSYNFTMGANAVNVNATFDAYSADSEYYYNGYDTSGNAKSGYHTKQMTEAMVNGQKFSYYEVTGRGSENDQLFTVSKGKPSSGTRYIYFTRPTDWGDGWSNSNNPHAYFLDASNNEKSGSWPGASSTSNYNNDYNQTVYKFPIPTGATNVIINDNGGSGKQTVNIDLTTTSGAYYLAGGGSGTAADGYKVGEWDTGNSDQGWVDSGTEYFYSNTIYVDNFYTGGFYNHNVPTVNDFTKPKDGNGNTFSSCKDDYYIVVLYPNTTYTISYNGHDTTNSVGSEPMVLWMSELPIESDTIKIYAKDGSIRSETNGVTYANIADTQIVASSTSTTSIGTSASGNISGQTYETYKAEKGDTIYILTTIDNVAGKGADNTTNRNKYYVRGFCVNGEVYELLSWNSSGVYRLTYKIPEDYDGSKIEITPIYYLKDTTTNKIVTFRVNGFTDALKQVGSGKPGWGNTLYAYPFYGSMGSNNNAFGAYPGQPLVYYNGQYQIQIPEKSTAWDPYLSDSALSGTDSAKKTQIAGTYVSGITMSNGYYDSVHRSIMGYGDDSTSADHVQTYDYGDFYKIFNEKTPVDNIVYEFKYKTAKDNRGTLGSTTSYTASTLTSTYTNGFETLKNYHGRAVDLFGTPLSGDAADPTKTPPMYVISIAGPNGSSGVANIAGYYATEWAVFATTATTVSTSNSYTRVSGGGKSSIPPEVLVLNDDDTTSFNTSTYPSAVSGVNITDWKTLYTTLEAYRGKPVLITYEKAKVQVGSNNYATSGGGGATRNDGRWLYSKTGESITSNIRIDVSTDNGVTYTPNDDLATPVTGLSAYFTNAEADGETTYSTTIDPDKEFDFEAKTTNGEYKFVGWYFDDGVKITSDNAGSTERSGSYTLVARFMYVDSGQLILAHHVDKSDANYQGDGTTTMSVRVLNGSDEVIRTIDETSSDITLDDKIIASDKTDYKIYITLKTVPKVAGEDIFYRTTCTQANKFLNNTSYLGTATPAEFYFTVGDLYSGTNQTVKSIIYNTKLSKTVYNYDFTFNYNGRLSDGQSYHKSGTLTAAQRETYVTGTGNEARVLSETFMNNIAPHESNFNQSYKWNITAADRTFTKTNSTTYTLTKTFNIQEKTVADEGETLRTTARTATFKLPYAYDTYGKATNTARMNKSSQADKVLNVSYGELIRDSAANNYSANDQARLQYYVTAPKILVDDGVDKTFQYWSIKKTGTDNEIARCYFESFNYVAYDNYTITPVFKADGDSSIVRNRTSASIDFLENSRNQWNDNGRGSYDTGNNTANNASDILFSDFALGFTLADGSSVADSDAEVGMVIQRIQKLQTKADGTPYTDVTDSVYDELQTVSADDLAQIRTFAGGGSAGSLSLVKDVVTKTNLDNKDMINYCHKFYNAIGDGDSKVNYSYKRYIYRAYAYIKVGNTVTLSDTPVYFTLWDEAAK